jgi:hypothetical protein
MSECPSGATTSPTLTEAQLQEFDRQAEEFLKAFYTADAIPDEARAGRESPFAIATRRLVAECRHLRSARQIRVVLDSERAAERAESPEPEVVLANHVPGRECGGDRYHHDLLEILALRIRRLQDEAERAATRIADLHELLVAVVPHVPDNEQTRTLDLPARFQRNWILCEPVF